MLSHLALSRGFHASIRSPTTQGTSKIVTRSNAPAWRPSPSSPSLSSLLQKQLSAHNSQRCIHTSSRTSFEDEPLRRGEEAPALPSRSERPKRRVSDSSAERDSDAPTERAPRRPPRASPRDEEAYLRQFPERTSFRLARKERRPQKSMQKAERYLDRMESNTDESSSRSAYRNDKDIPEEHLKRVERRRARIEAEIPTGPRLQSDETPVEPPDFTLSITSARPEDAPRLASVGSLSTLERRMSKLKPVTEKEKKEEQESELLERAKRAAAEAQADHLKNCWGCGVEFQTQTPTTMGYVPQLKLDRYKLQKELFDLQSQNDLTNTSAEIFAPTAEMLELERMLLGLEEDEDIEAVAPTPVKKAKDDKESKRHARPERVLCERCWNLRNKSKAVSVSMPAEYFKEVVAPIKQLKTRPLIIKMVDLFDFHGSFIPSFRKYIGNNRVLIVASKYDLLPKGVHPERIRSWVSTECRKFGIDPVGVALISHNGFGVRELADQLEYHRQGSDVYVMGSANVGKSTFINLLIDIFKGPKDKKVTVSPVPGTTLNFLSLPIGSSAFLYDTPGIITSKQIYNYLSGEELKKVMPKKQVHPSVYRLTPGSTIFIGGLARFDYLEGPPLVYFTLFASHEIYIHKTSVERADEIYASKVGTLLTPPFSPETVASWPGLDTEGTVHNIENDDGNWQKACTDIVFSGLGWISVTMKGTAKVRTFYPPDCLVGVRPPLMPFESRLGVMPNPRFNMKPSSVASRPNYEDTEL